MDYTISEVPSHVHVFGLHQSSFPIWLINIIKLENEINNYQRLSANNRFKKVQRMFPQIISGLLEGQFDQLEGVLIENT